MVNYSNIFWVLHGDSKVDFDVQMFLMTNIVQN
jgi:hypothetical protein